MSKTCGGEPPCKFYDKGLCTKHNTYTHWAHEAPCYEIAQDAPTPQPMGGYVAQAPLHAIKVNNVLQCAGCGSMNLSSSACRSCGRGWVYP